MAEERKERFRESEKRKEVEGLYDQIETRNAIISIIGVSCAYAVLREGVNNYLDRYLYIIIIAFAQHTNIPSLPTAPLGCLC